MIWTVSAYFADFFYFCLFWNASHATVHVTGNSIGLLVASIFTPCLIDVKINEQSTHDNNPTAVDRINKINHRLVKHVLVIYSNSVYQITEAARHNCKIITKQMQKIKLKNPTHPKIWHNSSTWWVILLLLLSIRQFLQEKDKVNNKFIVTLWWLNYVANVATGT